MQVGNVTELFTIVTHSIQSLQGGQLIQNNFSKNHTEAFRSKI